MTDESPKEKVRSVIYTVEHPHSINWVADTAGVQWETAQKYLKELEDEGLVVEVDGEYKTDTTGLYIREIRELILTHGAGELVEQAKQLEEQIESVKKNLRSVASQNWRSEPRRLNQCPSNVICMM